MRSRETLVSCFMRRREKRKSRKCRRTKRNGNEILHTFAAWSVTRRLHTAFESEIANDSSQVGHAALSFGLAIFDTLLGSGRECGGRSESQSKERKKEKINDRARTRAPNVLERANVDATIIHFFLFYLFLALSGACVVCNIWSLTRAWMRECLARKAIQTAKRNFICVSFLNRLLPLNFVFVWMRFTRRYRRRNIQFTQSSTPSLEQLTFFAAAAAAALQIAIAFSTPGYFFCARFAHMVAVAAVLLEFLFVLFFDNFLNAFLLSTASSVRSWCVHMRDVCSHRIEWSRVYSVQAFRLCVTFEFVPKKQDIYKMLEQKRFEKWQVAMSTLTILWLNDIADDAQNFPSQKGILCLRFLFSPRCVFLCENTSENSWRHRKNEQTDKEKCAHTSRR